MVFELNEVEIASDREQAFERAFMEAAQLFLRGPGRSSASLFRCVEQPGIYQIPIGWDRIRDHLDNYPKSVEAARIRSLLMPLVHCARRAHFEELPLAGPTS